MPTTPLQALPYPSMSDVANGPEAFRLLAEATERRLVMTFASATERDAAIPSPTEGMLAWMQDINQHVYYDSTKWSLLGASGNWTPYTPGIANYGSATFTTRKGRWKRIAHRTVAVNIALAVGAAGSGASNFQVALPTVPNRDARAQFDLNIERSDGLGIGQGVLTITGGDTGGGEYIDRLRAIIGTGVPGNLLGGSLLTDMIMSLSGVYEELT